MWQDVAGQNWLGVAGASRRVQRLSDLVICGRKWSDVRCWKKLDEATCGCMWPHVAACCQMCLDVAGCGRTWPDVGQCEQIKSEYKATIKQL